jgi:hypothetical protein
VPYDEERDQYYWDPFRQATGETFASDGSNYDPSYESPALSDAVRVLSKRGTLFRMLVSGRLKYKANGPFIETISGKVDIQSLIAISAGVEEKSEKEKRLEQQKIGAKFTRTKRFTKTNQTTNQKIQILFGLEVTPEKVTSIYFQVIS